ncbi:MAG: hypothetical protein M3R00_07615 [Pseudomonadota bacterium]|nr:hypothetical protein [Pseudomonadota bacterium]
MNERIIPKRSREEDEQPISSSVCILPAYIAEFIDENQSLFNDLVAEYSNASFADYLTANPFGNAFFKSLHSALMAVIANDETSKIVSQSTIIDEEPILQINFAKLIHLLRNPKNQNEFSLNRLLIEGMQMWRLPMIAQIHQLSTTEEGAVQLRALTWLERRRRFIKSTITQNVKLMAWLNNDNQQAMKAILQRFSHAIFNVLNEEDDIWFIDEQSQGNISRLPKIMDVRKLWYTLFMRELIHEDDNSLNIITLLNFTQKELTFNLHVPFFDSAQPSPVSCFIDSFNGLDTSERHRKNLPVPNDVLTGLLVMHSDNKRLAIEILEHAKDVDNVCKAYAQHQKQARTSLIANSMSNALKAIHNSPTKQAMSPKSKLAPISPNKSKKLKIDFDSQSSLKL